MKSVRLVVALVVLASAAACGGGYSSPTPPPSPSPAPAPAPGGPSAGPSSSVTIPVGASVLGRGAFNPSDVTVAVGTTVTWLNTDTVAHTSTSDAVGWNSNTIAPGGQFSNAFPTAGTFSYHCAIHPGMVGTVVVR